MTGIKPRYPLDLTGRSPTNLVPGERKILLDRGDTPYRVVSFLAGGFYARSLKVYDSAFKRLTANVDYIATYTHADLSAYTGMEVCSTVVILNPDITGSVIIGAQIVGSDLAFALSAEDETVNYLESLPVGETPVWGGLLGDYPQWQPGELQEALWERHHYGHLNKSIEDLVRAVNQGNGEAEDTTRAEIRQLTQAFIDGLGDAVLRHINDTDRPHPITKYHVGLSLVENYPVATLNQAREGSSETLYLTPQTLQEMLRQFASNPLQTHLDSRFHTHSPTAEQVGTYTTAQLAPRFAAKVGITETVNNATGFEGYLATAPGTTIRFSQIGLYNELRLELNASSISEGVLDPRRLGIGSPGGYTYLGGDGIWRDFMSLYRQLADENNTRVYYAGSLGNTTNGLAHIRSTYANVTAYPPGTIVVFKVTNNEYHVSYNNGSSGWQSRQSNRAAIRSTSGWFVLN